jgi:hypothetical protein
MQRLQIEIRILGSDKFIHDFPLGREILSFLGGELVVCMPCGDGFLAS